MKINFDKLKMHIVNYGGDAQEIIGKRYLQEDTSGDEMGNRVKENEEQVRRLEPK